MKLRAICIEVMITLFFIMSYLVVSANNTRQIVEYIISLTENDMLLAAASDGSHHLSINSPGLSLVLIIFVLLMTVPRLLFNPV